MPHLVISLLGTFKVTLDTAPVTGFKSRYVRALLAYLAVESYRPHTRETLAEFLWPDLPNNIALSNLRYAISNLRQVLGDRLVDHPYLIVTRETTQFNTASDYELDVEVLKNLGQNNLGWSDPLHNEQGRGAVLFRGAFLEGFSIKSAEFEEWMIYWREKVNHQMITVLSDLAAHFEESGKYKESIVCASRLIELDPWEEASHRALMRCLAFSLQKSAALAQYDRCSQILQQDLGISPSIETTNLYQEILAGKLTPRVITPSDKAIATPFSNIPSPLTSFIGRQTEIESIKLLLSKHRLITLVGPGGCGKTRLANEIIRSLITTQRYENRVWWVDLAPLSDPALLLQAISGAIGLQENPGVALIVDLCNHLRPHEALIILDNCEHLLTACAQIIEILLNACDHLQVMATSRASINLIGESIFNVPPLSLPPENSSYMAGDLLSFEAIQLFLDRASAVLPGFELTRANASAVIQICRQLDGIPLAIELAAVRVKLLSVEQIASRLGDRFQLLTSNSGTMIARHQTLRAAIDWSYELLSEPESTLLNSLAIFTGSFTLKAVETVCSSDKNVTVLDLLSRLVDKSLVMVQPQEPEARYWLSETIRQYAYEKLELSGKTNLVCERLLDYESHLAKEAENRLYKPDHVIWLNYLEKENNNLRKVIAWAVNGGSPERGLHLAGMLADYWLMRGYLSEGRDWLKKALDCCQGAPAFLRATVAVKAGFLSFQQGVVEETIHYGEESLALFQELGEKRGMASSLLLLGIAAHYQGNIDREASLLKESLSLSRESNDQANAADTLLWMGRARMKQGDFDLAAEMLNESFKMYQESGNKDGMAFAIGSLGDMERRQGNFPRAAELRKEGLRLACQAGSRSEICYGLEHLALIAALDGKNEHAVKLWGAAEVLRTALNRSLVPSYEIEYRSAVADARASLGEEQFTNAWRQGSEMTEEQAIEYALT
jgi:predicted ATPase/DNA-binding SARP family transcriptional activator